jgi:sulfur carrier protein
MIQVNGEPMELGSACSLQGLIEQLRLGGRRLAVEINGEIVPRSQYSERVIAEGDRLEIVHAIGGG